MSNPPMRVMVVGATGVFGERLARRLARWPDVVLIIAARRRAVLERLRADIETAGAVNPIEIAVFDRETPAGLAGLRSWAVIDCAGPFQMPDFRLAEAALRCGAHYLDLADGRAFVAGFARSLDGLARATKLSCVTAASSSPAIGHAVLDEMTRGWRRIDRIEVAIYPDARVASGLSVIRAVLSWAGRPVELLVDGEHREKPGWGLLRRVHTRDLGVRWTSLAETADLDLLPQRYRPERDAVFRAGLQSSLEHLGLWLLSWPVRLGWVGSLEALARPLQSLARAVPFCGAPNGGMSVEASGQGPDGNMVRARWSLLARSGRGPAVPTLPAAAMLRAWLDGRLLGEGAQACVGLLTLDEILAQADDLPISTTFEFGSPASTSMSRRLMGARFDELPLSVRQVHAGDCPATFAGRARARGTAGPAGLARKLAGMPAPGLYDPIKVAIAPGSVDETWTRTFGPTTFRSRLRDDPRHIGRFEESIGPLTFAFDADPNRTGFRWRFAGWRIGPIPLPRALAPPIRARCFDRDGVYRFSVVVAHPWLGLVLAYVGRLGPSVRVPPSA